MDCGIGPELGIQIMCGSFLFLVMKTNDKVLSGPASTKLWFYSNFRTRNAKLSYKGTKNVAIFAFSLGKFLDFRKYACVKDLTNIMSALSRLMVSLIVKYPFLWLPLQITKECMLGRHHWPFAWKLCWKDFTQLIHLKDHQSVHGSRHFGNDC